MSDFTPIETQEQLNAVIGERIRRAEEKAAAKYADYDEIKTQNEAYTKQLADLQEQLKKQTETIDGNKSIVDDLTAKVQSYETSSLKTKIALELGLPYQMAGRLTGDDEDAIRKDAEAMVELIGKNQPIAPLGNPEPSLTGKSKEDIAKIKFGEWLKNT